MSQPIKLMPRRVGRDRLNTETGPIALHLLLPYCPFFLFFICLEMTPHIHAVVFYRAYIFSSSQNTTQKVS